MNKKKDGLKKKVVIVSPRQKYGGAIVLHLLCQLLIEENIDAKVFLTEVYGDKKDNYFKFLFKWVKWVIKDTVKVILSKYFNKKFIDFENEAIKNYKRKYLPFINRKSTIVIYPEVCYGNILKAKYVIRWFLYYNKFKNDEKAYDKNDIFICYRKKFNDYELNPECNQLRISHFSNGTYKQTNFGDRSGCCYIIRKGSKRKDLPTKYNGPIIDDLSEKEKVEAFNKYKYCYLYDTQTLYARIAGYCGCIPIVLLEQGKNVDDYISDEDVRYGIAYGNTNDEINYAINTNSKLKEYLDTLELKNRENVREFIKLLEKL